MQKKLDVVFTIDENYIQHFCVACTSLLENNVNIGRVFLVQDIKQNIKKLEKAINFLEKEYAIKVEKFSLDSKILDNFKITHHISKATYFRLLLSEILPKDVDSVMFLDSDIVVNGSLDEILELDFLKEYNFYGAYQYKQDDISCSSSYEYYIFAVDHNYGDNELARLREIGFEENRYFNAGIMYINLKKWREDGVSTILIENAAKYNNYLLWWDQDVLNITFKKEWAELDFKYNAYGLKIKDETQDYRIIHYTGSSKPWHFRNKHPYKHLYWKYLKMTPFKRYIPEDLTVLNVIKWMIPASVKNVIKKVVGKV